MSDGTILLVDDESMIRDLLMDILNDSGDYDILTASNGKEGLDICLSQEIDLVFTDLRMPVMEGMELLAELRNHKPNIPVVILTGYGRREDVIEALRLGASNFLLKPQEVENVRTIASKILRVRTKERLEQEIFEFFVYETLAFKIKSELRYTLPLIDQLTDRVVQAKVCDDSELMNLRLALDEALVNSIIHGNLEIESTDKGATLEELLKFNTMVREKSLQEPYCHRLVHITSELTADYAKFVVQDEGKGFDWQSRSSNLDDVEIMANYGRGLFLIRAFMSEVTFNATGNCITMIRYKDDSRGQP